MIFSMSAIDLIFFMTGLRLITHRNSYLRRIYRQTVVFIILFLIGRLFDVKNIMKALKVSLALMLSGIFGIQNQLGTMIENEIFHFV